MRISFFILPCLWKWLTGYDCPFCGFQRAMRTLLFEGDLLAALEFNWFLAFVLPYSFLLITMSWLAKNKTWAAKVFKCICNPVVAVVCMVLTVAWTIGRNIWGI